MSRGDMTGKIGTIYAGWRPFHFTLRSPVAMIKGFDDVSKVAEKGDGDERSGGGFAETRRQI